MIWTNIYMYLAHFLVQLYVEKYFEFEKNAVSFVTSFTSSDFDWYMYVIRWCFTIKSTVGWSGDILMI